MSESFHESMDAAVWAKEFRETAVSLGYSDMDEAWLIGWFANAVMRGWDTQYQRLEKRLAAADMVAGALDDLIEIAHNTYDIPDEMFRALSIYRAAQ